MARSVNQNGEIAHLLDTMTLGVVKTLGIKCCSFAIRDDRSLNQGVFGLKCSHKYGNRFKYTII